MKLSAPELAGTSCEARNEALRAIAAALETARDGIFAVNAEDLAAAEAAGVAEAVKKRLKFDEAKLADCVAGIGQLVGLPDPLGKVTLHRELDEGLVMQRVTVPIGVIGVIFEARPDALVQIASLCLKSGNCAILKGGSETAKTNRALFSVIHRAATEAGLPENCLHLAETHSEIDELLACDKEVDLLIPRGSNAFVRYIMEHTKIPVLGHADRICHNNVDASADPEQAIRVILDAKTQDAAASNAVETVLVDRRIAAAFVPDLAKALKEAGVRIHGTDEVASLIDCEPVGETGFSTEYLELALTIALVDGAAAASAHINRYGSHHTDAILATDEAAIRYFRQTVDSAGVYVNCSTRFADGFRYGFGAEVGISTSKIHARGPVGLEGLETYKYLITGGGHIVGDYASGEKSFRFRDL